MIFFRKKTEKTPVIETSTTPQAEAPSTGNSKSWLKQWSVKLTSGLNKSATKLVENFARVFTHKKLDQQALDDLEALLIQADLGVKTAQNICAELAKQRFEKEITAQEVQNFCANYIANQLQPYAQPLRLDSTPGQRQVIMVIGVNGSGKTTTIAKLGANFQRQGHQVTLVAADTFRAAAIEQLTIWAERLHLPLIKRTPGADAAGLVFDAMAQAQEVDALIIDTAGRLHNRDDLMQELGKIERVMKKVDPTAPHHCVLVLDATIGQNALQQVESFLKYVKITGIILTKLDGTARGGVVVSLIEKFKLPVHNIGVGETAEDLCEFDAKSFANSLFNAQSV